jgi:hypothetical protein
MSSAAIVELCARVSLTCALVWRDLRRQVACLLHRVYVVTQQNVCFEIFAMHTFFQFGFFFVLEDD